MSISDNDIASYYPSSMGLFDYKAKPRELFLEVLEPPHRNRYSVYVKNGDWFVDRELMLAWCNEKFGGHSALYNNPRWHRDGYYFRFKNKGDATMFILRWS